MKASKIFSGLFALLGIVVGAGTVLLCLHFLQQGPVLLKTPYMAVNRVDALFQAVCDDDYARASELIYGNPDLGAARQEEESVSNEIWAAFVDSMGYELVGECYAMDTGIAQKVYLSYLDVTSVTDGLQARARTLLQQRVAEAEDVKEIYDENNEYRQDFVDSVVADAAKEALKQDARYVETELTVVLVYDGGQWWILADDMLIQAISGGIAQ